MSSGPVKIKYSYDFVYIQDKILKAEDIIKEKNDQDKLSSVSESPAIERPNDGDGKM